MDIPSAKIYGEVKIASNRYLRKIEFEGHTYIHLKNDWVASADNILHDPDCKCHKKGQNENT